MNVHDSENISAIMEDMSYTRVNDMEMADVIIVNTCGFIESAKAEAKKAADARAKAKAEKKAGK